MVSQGFNPSSWEADAGRTLNSGQYVLHGQGPSFCFVFFLKVKKGKYTQSKGFT